MHILPIASSSYDRQLDLTKKPKKYSKRDLHDAHYAKQIKRIWQESSGRYGVRKATLDWVDWLNKKQLHTAIGYVSPFQFEDVYYDKIEPLGLVA